MSLLDRFFKLKEHGTSVRTEIIAGVTTFLTMAYIILVNPLILSGTGMNLDAVFVATCLAAALGTAIMALVANYPIALAPGMGLNAYFTFTVVGGMGVPWQTALGAVFISGIVFLAVSLFKVREAIVNAIPRSLKFAISVGVGMFLAIIALKNASVIKAHPATYLTLGDLHSPSTLLAILGFFIIVALEYRKVPGSIILGILAVTALSIALGLMTCGLAEIDWDDLTESAPAVMTALAMPFTFSIADGIAFGFISYAALKLLSGRFAELKPAVLAIAGLWIFKLAFFA
ncbi:MAG: NCS2 family permease [Pseudogulbenkiania sp.]|nr:NCS2 family permease [Pseudogulbenkiania sp.]